MYNYDMFGKHMKVSDVIEQSYIYFIMALRKYLTWLLKSYTTPLKKQGSENPKPKKKKGIEEGSVWHLQERVNFSS